MKKLQLPPAIAAACAPLFEALPLEQAMPHLTGSDPTHLEILEEVLNDPALSGRPELAAALFLYVSDLDRSHTLSQGVTNTTGSYWHGIMHRREGDFSNSHYWMRMAAGHPLRTARPDLDPDAFIDQVAEARGADMPELVARQREEWQALFEWCCGQGA